MNSAFKKRVVSLTYGNDKQDCLLPEIFLKETFAQLQSEVGDFLKVNYALKFNIDLHGLYAKPNLEDVENSQQEVKTFQTEIKEIFDINNFAKEFSLQSNNIMQQMEEFQDRDSGWTLLKIIKMVLNLSRYQPLKGSSFIPLPTPLALKQACVNVKNKDKYCFKWAVISAVVNLPKFGYRTSTYKVNICSKFMKFNDYDLDFGGLCFPLKLNDISIFEENNPNISINVFGYDADKNLVVGPHYKTKQRKSKHINLLFLEKNVGEERNAHYVWIKNMSRLIGSQKTGHNKKVFICDDCLQHFYAKEKFETHYKNFCQDIVNVPRKEKSIFEFEKYANRTEIPFVIYADSVGIFQDIRNTFSRPYAYSYYIKCNFNSEINKLRFFEGYDSPSKFVKSLVEDISFLYINYINPTKPISHLTKEENVHFLSNSMCHICSKLISKGDKVKYYCRISGKYMGPAHTACITNNKPSNMFPVIFPNLTAQNCYFLIKELNSIDDGAINIIPFNKDCYISLTKGIETEKGYKIRIRFFDSSRFMPERLENLVKKLTENDLKSLQSMCAEDEGKFKLLMRKVSVFPYSYLNSLEKLNESCLPNIEHFHDKLKGTQCSSEDYSHANEVWRKFKCKSLQEYLDLCLKCNVLLLSDIFDNFRVICKSEFNLDICHYYTLADFSWEAMLKSTKVKLDLITDKCMISFLQQGLRGGIVQCTQRHAVANNKYLNDYNDKLPSKYLIFFETNNMYNWAMSQPLPTDSFEWISDIDKFSLDSITNDSTVGYILEVDLKYPQEIHESHNDLPFCSEYKTPPDGKEKKLLVNLKPKNEYVIYYKNLQQCLKHGLKLEKIHRILKFKQSDWLRMYVTQNNSHSTKAKNSFEKYVFNILNDAIYDKIMHNIDKGKTIKIVNKWENDSKVLGARAFIAKSEFNSINIFDENIVAIELNTTYAYYNKLNYLEFTISELIKLQMYNLHYDYLIPKYTDNIELNYMDTNTFLYTITTEDFFKDVKDDFELKFNMTSKVILKKFVALRSKMYSFKVEEMIATKKRKRGKSNVVPNLCLTPLYNKNLYSKSDNLFKAKLHSLYTRLFDKLSLSSLDNKRYICYDNIKTFAWGHYKETILNYNVDNDYLMEVDNSYLNK